MMNESSGEKNGSQIAGTDAQNEEEKVIPALARKTMSFGFRAIRRKVVGASLCGALAFVIGAIIYAQADKPKIWYLVALILTAVIWWVTIVFVHGLEHGESPTSPTQPSGPTTSGATTQVTTEAPRPCEQGDFAKANTISTFVDVVHAHCRWLDKAVAVQDSPDARAGVHAIYAVEAAKRLGITIPQPIPQQGTLASVELRWFESLANSAIASAVDTKSVREQRDRLVKELVNIYAKGSKWVVYRHYRSTPGYVFNHDLADFPNDLQSQYESIREIKRLVEAGIDRWISRSLGTPSGQWTGNLLRILSDVQGHLYVNDPKTPETKDLPESLWDELVQKMPGRSKASLRDEAALARRTAIEIVDQSYSALQRLTQQISDIDISHYS